METGRKEENFFLSSNTAGTIAAEMQSATHKRSRVFMDTTNDSSYSLSRFWNAKVDILPRLSSPLGGKAKDSSLEFCLDRYGTIGFLRKPDCERGTSLVFASRRSSWTSKSPLWGIVRLRTNHLFPKGSHSLHRLIAHRKNHP